MSVVFPAPYAHTHPPVANVTQDAHGKRTTGERAADWVANLVWSWKFILIQSALLLLWVALNAVVLIRGWDPYPFILLNLLLSLQAAYTAPVIMMSQNRQAALDRIRAEHDFQINLKAEDEVRVVLEHLDAQAVVLQQLAKDVQGLKAPTR